MLFSHNINEIHILLVKNIMFTSVTCLTKTVEILKDVIVNEETNVITKSENEHTNTVAYMQLASLSDSEACYYK